MGALKVLMKKYLCYVLAILASLSCQQTLEPVLSFEKTELLCGTESSKAVVGLDANISWKVQSIPRFVTVSPIKGDGSCEFTISVNTNDSPLPRNGNVVLTGCVNELDATASIAVYQDGAKPFVSFIGWRKPHFIRPEEL